MVRTLRITAVGDSTGIVLPKEVLDRLQVSKGDKLFLVETANGFEITAYEPAFLKQMETAERVMREDQDVLRKLAE